MKPPTNKLEFGFKATPRQMEIINWILGQSLQQLKVPEVRERHEVSAVDVHEVEQIKNELLNQLLNPI